MPNFNRAFWKWFGDSKVVDKHGDPLVVFHGSVNSGFTTFKKSEPVRWRSGPDGFYFTSDANAAYNYVRDPKTKKRGQVFAVYLSIQNPLDITDDIKKFQKKGMSFGDAKREALKKLNDDHDGVLFRGNSMNPDEIIAFYPEQIKSVENDGEWSPESDDIRHNPEYSGEHGAPDKESGAPLWDVTLNGIYPKDFYETMHQYHYGEADDSEAFYLISQKHNHPNSPVWVYRAIPSNVKEKELNPGDWVTLSRSYAKEHGEDNLNGKFKIIKQKVHARDLFTAGDSVLEWGYDPQPVDRDALLESRIRWWKKSGLSEREISQNVSEWRARNEA